MINFIEYNGQNKLITATNLQFDFNGIYLEEDEFFNYDIIMKNGNYLMCNDNELKIKFIDTLNYSKSSVEKLGELIGSKKMRKPKNLGEKAKTKQELYELKRYNKQDCKISKEFMEYFQKAINELGGELKITIASCSMDLFRRKYLKKPIHHESINVRDLVFESYYGGRTEAFGRGRIKTLLKNNKKEFLYYLDFNSMYPYVMQKEYPNPSSCKRLTTFNNIEENIKKYHGVTKCDIGSPLWLKYPLLPYRDDKLVFPLGTFTGTWNNIELRKALELGYKIIKVHEAIIYTQTITPFKEWVNDLYNKRMKYKKDGNEIMSYASKIILNSLYGKFGSKTIEEVKFIDLWKKKRIRTGYYMQNPKDYESRFGYIIKEKECEENYVIPIFASCVTAYSRLELYDAIVKYDAVYCDTDSVFTLKKPEKDETQLGGLKIEGVVVDGLIIKPKAYYIKTIDKEFIKFKGINRIDKEMFNDLIDNKPVEQIKFLKIKESLKRGLTPNEIISFYKSVDLEDDKREWKYKFNKNSFQFSKARWYSRKKLLK